MMTTTAMTITDSDGDYLLSDGLKDSLHDDVSNEHCQVVVTRRLGGASRWHFSAPLATGSLVPYFFRLIPVVAPLWCRRFRINI